MMEWRKAEKVLEAERKKRTMYSSNTGKFRKYKGVGLRFGIRRPK